MRLRLSAVVLIAVCSIAVFSPAAMGQEEPSPETTTSAPPTTTTSTSTPSDPASDDEADEASDDSTTEVVVTLLFGVLVIFGFFTYLHLAQNRYFTVAAEVLKRSKQELGESEQVPTLYGRELRAEEKLEVLGSTTMELGKPSSYSVEADNQGEETAWTVSPEGVAEVKPATGNEVEVTAKTAGTFTLGVSRGSALGGMKIVVTEPTYDKGARLPFVGAGYGTVVIAISLISVAGALGLAEVLSSDAIATLFGAIAGYIFLKAAGNETDGEKEQQPPAAGNGPAAP